MCHSKHLLVPHKPRVPCKKRSTSTLNVESFLANPYRKLEDVTEKLAAGFSWPAAFDALADVYLGVRSSTNFVLAHC
jgi:hypothetical protein